MRVLSRPCDPSVPASSDECQRFGIDLLGKPDPPRHGQVMVPSASRVESVTVLGGSVGRVLDRCGERLRLRRQWRSGPAPGRIGAVTPGPFQVRQPFRRGILMSRPLKLPPARWRRFDLRSALPVSASLPCGIRALFGAASGVTASASRHLDINASMLQFLCHENDSEH